MPYRATRGIGDKKMAILCRLAALVHVKLQFTPFLALCLMAQAPATWKIRTVAGGNAAGDGGRAADASIRFLQSVAVDDLGNVYFADADDHRVRRIDAFGVVTTLAGDGVPGYSGDRGPAAQARVNTPYGLCLSPLGDLIFADLGNARIRRISRDGQIDTIIGGGTRPLPVGGQSVPPLEVKLVAPRNVLATRSGSLYVSEFGGNSILELRADGTFRTVVSDVLAPTGLAVDTDGSLLFLDSGRATVRKLRADGRTEIVLAPSPAMPLERPLGLAMRRDQSLLIADTRGDFLWQRDSRANITSFPPGGRDVTLDSLGNILTAGGTWLRRLNLSGLTEILIGNTYSTHRGDGGPALLARLNQPLGVAADSKGNLFFCDSANHRVRRIATDGTITTVAGFGEASYRGDGGPAIEAGLRSPTYLAIDAFDNVYVSDSGNNRIRAFTPGGVIQTVAGTGRYEFSNDNIFATQASLANPAGLAFDGEGVLYVAERNQNRIRRFAPGGRIVTVAGNALRGNSGDQQDALLASLNSPGALAIDSQGDLYIGDSGNNSIRVVARATGRIRTLISDLKSPDGLAVAPNGTLYFGDSKRHIVEQLTMAGDRSVAAGRVNENGFNGEEGNANAITLNEPAGLALLRGGGLVVADRLNNRVRILESTAEIVASILQTYRVVHAATFQETNIAPGLLMSLLTDQISQPELAEVTLDSIAAPISFVSPTQVNFQVPYAIAGRSQVLLEFRVGGALRYKAILKVVAAAPAFFEVPGSGGLVSAAIAHVGDIVTLKATGEGLLHDLEGVNVPFLDCSVSLDGVDAELLYVGAPLGSPGPIQINLRMPNGIRRGGRLKVILSLGPYSTTKSQFIAVE